MKSKIIWLVVTLVLGALGSGLWELAFKPIISWSATYALDIVTLGFDSLRNSLYEDAAKGQYERVAISLLSAFAGTLTGITSCVVFINTFKKRDLTNNISRRSYISLSGPLPLVFICIILFLNVQRICYINRAVNYFDHLSSITAPFLSEHERLVVQSNFAQITTREQYVAVIGYLRSICTRQGIKAPEFSIY